jgi:hypothetical protein
VTRPPARHSYQPQAQEIAIRWLPSATALVAANLVPLGGVLFFGWDVFVVVFLFWLENVVVGFFNVLRMLWVERGAEQAPLAKFFVMPFFVVHYGMFTAIHGVFVLVLFGGLGVRGASFPTLDTVVHVIAEYHLWLAVVALFVSHGYSFLTNYVARQEYRRVTLQDLMKQPYGRVVVLHLTILLGGFLAMALQLPAVGAFLLVVLKVALDLRAHLREHARLHDGLV